MSNAKPKAVAEINLEEFERRLRASVAPQAGVEDPLAELTRLVDTIGFERSAAERALEKAPKPAPKAELQLAPPSPPPEPPPAPAALAPPPAALAPPSPEPPPRAAEDAPELRPAFDADDLEPAAFEPPPPSMAAAEPPPVAAARAEPPRARNWGLKVGGLIAAAAVMAGAVVVFKVGGHARSGAPPLILASTAPTKAPPPNDATIRTANESGALLNRDSAQPTPAAPKLVSTPEAPVDLSARPTPSGSAAPAPSPSPSASADAEASPVAPSANTPIVASVAPPATPVSPVGDDPNRVKTISVRPDGTLISSGYEANAAATPEPAPSPTVEPPKAIADADAATPAAPLPTKLSPPKNAARVSATATTAPADAGDGPAPVAPKPKKVKPKPTPVAEAEAKAPDAKTDDGGEAPPVASGGYAVQLAAPKSEGEAKALVKRFESKFAGALGSTALGVRKADRHGEAIYRVRAGGLSREDAKAMCEKIKGEGGDCYVAKN